MSTFVLVHGAWFGGWCWSRLTPLLEAAGHTVVVRDLPGHGDDTTPVEGITLDTLADSVGETLAGLGEPVILVGHSMGGIVLSRAAEKHPEKIARLVYLAAFLLPEGKSLFDMSLSDTGSQLGPYVLAEPEKGLIGIRPEALRDIFLHDAPEEVVVEAEARLRPDLIVPQTTPMHISNEKFGNVPRTYITTLNDRVVSPALQTQMYTSSPCESVLEIETGHSPFAAAPEKLAARLISST